MTRCLRFLVFVSLFCGWRVALASVYVSGQVTDQSGGQFVADAVLALYPMSGATPVAATKSLRNGSFVLTAPLPGRYRLTVGGPGINPHEEPLEVPRDGLASIKITVEALPVIHVRVLSSDGEPLHPGGAKMYVFVVVASEHHSGANATFNTHETAANLAPNASGELIIDAPTGCSLSDMTSLTISVRDKLLGCGLDHAARWPKQPLTIRLQPGAVVVGTVNDANQKGVAGAVVVATAPQLIGRSADRTSAQNPARYMGTAVAITDAAGHFRIPSLLPGSTIVLRTKIPGLGWRSRSLNLAKGDNSTTIGPEDNAGSLLNLD